MRTQSLSPLLAEAERAIREAVSHYKLTVPSSRILVTIQSHGKRNAVGWFGPDRWQNGADKPIHEINLSAECLKSHDMGELILHELAHAENQHLKVKDCAGRIHNKKFKAMAERLGLKVGPRDSSVGYGFTDLDKPGSDFLKKIEFKHKLFKAARIPMHGRKGPGSRLIKCACPECDYTIRTTQKWLDVGLPVCPCGEEMVEQ